MGLFPLLVAVLALLATLRCLCGVCTSQRDRLGSFLFWNWPIAFLRDSYVVIAICSLYNLRYRSWHNEEASTNTGFASGFLFLLTAYPLLSQLFLYWRRDMLDKKAFRDKFEEAYTGLSTKGRNYLIYPLFFYFRRVLVPLSVIFFPTAIIAQLLTMELTGLAMLVLIAFQQPFERSAQNKNQALQEMVILLITYNLLCFTAWLPDPNLRRGAGYSVITVVGVQLFGTLGALAIRDIYSRISIARRNRYISLAKKRARLYLEKRGPQRLVAVQGRQARQFAFTETSIDICLSSGSESQSSEASVPPSSSRPLEEQKRQAESQKPKFSGAPITRVSKHPKQIRYRLMGELKSSRDDDSLPSILLSEPRKDELMELSFGRQAQQPLAMQPQKQVGASLLIDDIRTDERHIPSSKSLPHDTDYLTQEELRAIDSLFPRSNPAAGSAGSMLLAPQQGQSSMAARGGSAIDIANETYTRLIRSKEPTQTAKNDWQLGHGYFYGAGPAQQLSKAPSMASLARGGSRVQPLESQVPTLASQQYDLDGDISEREFRQRRQVRPKFATAFMRYYANADQ